MAINRDNIKRKFKILVVSLTLVSSLVKLVTHLFLAKNNKLIEENKCKCLLILELRVGVGWHIAFVL